MGMDASPLGEPVVCSKCNLLFDTDSDYIERYDQKHKRDNWSQGFNIQLELALQKLANVRIRTA